jgi:hypothetical protein
MQPVKQPLERTSVSTRPSPPSKAPHRGVAGQATGATVRRRRRMSAEARRRVSAGMRKWWAGRKKKGA